MLLLHFNFSSSGKGLWNTLYLCTSVCCLFVHRFSLEPLVETWFILCKVRLSSSLQSDCAGFFWKNNFWAFWMKRVQNGPKLRLFKLYEKLMQGIFLVFCINIQQHNFLKLAGMIFWGKIWFRGFQAKSGQNGSKMKFFRQDEKESFRTFLIFCMKL